ncbi:L-iduronidase [Halogranum amylolyticum]|uniref:L-iduronidase n=1 Tax=Halogranum amylolyticum TaxID=660520 RepID=A0A1H8TH42_9EURY|nr:hypothetical protein [Halogranum amylolyticum]SEO89828.1 L-iduronidase [Halogranum amylolyticum]
MHISIDCDSSVGSFPHFWQSTGFTPARLLLNDDTVQAMTYVGAIPHDGVTHVRVHYLLDLVRVDDPMLTEPTYDWTDLDDALDVLVGNGLKPFFELMGNPSNWFTDFCDDDQLHAWKRMVRDLADHLMDRYGESEVETWCFETWNEPDLSHISGWDQFGFARNTDAFCNYYDACSEGLNEANDALRFGGPGTAKLLSRVFKDLVAHCDEGTNYFTGEEGVRIDFISVHEKGATHHPEDFTPDTEGICEREIHTMEYVEEHHPELATKPFMNNECDPQVGWADTHTWRAQPQYPAIACKMISQHLDHIIDGTDYRYELLSNDHGFIGTWGQRTLLTRFGASHAETDPNRAQVRPRLDTFEFVKKPIYNTMVLLSLLGDERLSVARDDVHDDVDVIATARDGEQVAVLASHGRDRPSSSGTASIDLTLDGVPFEEAALVQYRLDEDHGNPYRVWEETFCDHYQVSEEVNRDREIPTDEELGQLRKHHELPLVETPQQLVVEDGTVDLSFDLPLPGVSLVLLTQKPTSEPPTVNGLRTNAYRGLNSVGGQVMVSWEGVESRNIRTYEVLRSESPDGPFERVNYGDTLCSAFLDTTVPAGVEDLYYSVRTVDYWGRKGERSDLIHWNK